jgi:hypothetical protein
MMAASLPVVTQRYDDWHRGIPKGLLPDMNLLTVDVQGMEYEVLQVSHGCLTHNTILKQPKSNSFAGNGESIRFF